MIMLAIPDPSIKEIGLYFLAIFLFLDLLSMACIFCIPCIVFGEICIKKLSKINDYTETLKTISNPLINYLYKHQQQDGSNDILDNVCQFNSDELIMEPGIIDKLSQLSRKYLFWDNKHSSIQNNRTELHELEAGMLTSDSENDFDGEKFLLN